MPPVSTKEPLEDGEREALLASFAEFPVDLDARTTHVFFGTACHPWSLRWVDEANWKIVRLADGPWVTYNRAKTYVQTRIELDLAIEPWIEGFLSTEAGHSEREVPSASQPVRKADRS